MLETPEGEPFYSQGLRFSCTRCSACCRHESGYVFLSEKDASLLGTALNMGYGELTQAYCRWIPSGNGESQLSLKEKPNNDCIFWQLELDSGQEGGCLVYEARPLQCRAFPFWPSVLSSKRKWEELAKECPGTGSGTLYSQDLIKKWLAMMQNEPIISKGAS